MAEDEGRILSGDHLFLGDGSSGASICCVWAKGSGEVVGNGFGAVRKTGDCVWTGSSAMTHLGECSWDWRYRPGVRLIRLLGIFVGSPDAVAELAKVENEPENLTH